MRILILALACSLVWGTADAKEKTKKKSPPPLQGIALVIDPGHGGEDSGAVGTVIEKSRVIHIEEAPYMYDVALRFKRLATAKGAVVMLTREASNWRRPRNLPFPHEGNRDIYTTGGGTPRSGYPGLRPRTDAAHRWFNLYGETHKTVFLSLHFDNSLNHRISGAYVIEPEERSVIGGFVVEAFKSQKLARTQQELPFLQLVQNGDAARGVRPLYVLKGKHNPISERVLVELGNFANPVDTARLRNPQGRQLYAQILVDALVEFKKHK